MLSPGRYHELIPRDEQRNLLWRQEELILCKADRQRQRAVWELCRQDILYYVNGWVWQYNPRRGGSEVGPFVTWDFQDEAIRAILEAIEDGRDLVIEKSREMGASWMCLLVMEWMWHFHPFKKFLCISRSAEMVDSAADDSLFWKIDFVHRYLPGWLLPRFKRTGMFYGNEDNGSAITGQASTGKAGVGGRATAMFVDEFSQIREDYEVLHRTADTTGCRIFNFTHTDISNAAAELSRRVDMRKLHLHWSQHPAKRGGLYRFEAGKVDVLDKAFEYPEDFHFVMDGRPKGGPYPGLRSPWYDYECVRRGSERAVAMDLDIDVRGSMSQFFDPLLIHILKQTYCTSPVWEGELKYDANGRPLELLQMNGGHLRLWLHPLAGCSVPEGPYTVGADLSAGTGATNSCFALCHALTGEKVAEYTNPTILPENLAYYAVALCRLFGEARIAWEVPGPGIVFGKKMMELGYRNIYYREDETRAASQRNYSDQPGWFSSPTPKRLLLEEYRAALATRQFLNRSAEALDECLSFRYTSQGNVEHGGISGGDDPSGARENHGDRVIADALAWKLAKPSWAREKKREAEKVPVLSLAWRREFHERRSEERERPLDW